MPTKNPASKKNLPSPNTRCGSAPVRFANSAKYTNVSRLSRDEQANTSRQAASVHPSEGRKSRAKASAMRGSTHR